MPPGVVNLLSGDPPSIASQLIQSDIIKKISITGSSRVGKLILKQAADKVQRVTMELSGHSPFIVFDDADIKKAADIAIAAKFRNNGQVCISPNRFYIHEKKKDEFADLMVKKTKKLKMGNGMDKDTLLGPLCTKQRLEGVEKLVETTKIEGGRLLLGGKRAANFNTGYYYEPTIFDNIKDNFSIMKEEPFGPIVPILSFKDFDEVMNRANDNDLGLASYVYTTDLKKANKASEQLETGCVAVNTPVVAVAEAYFENIDITKKGSGWKAYQRWLYENELKYYPSGIRNNVKSDFVSEEYKDFLSKGSLTNKSGFENGWEELGPYYIEEVTGHYAVGLGRIESFYTDLNNENRIFLGSRSGGFWKTLYGGETWENTTDFLFASGVNTIAV